MPDTEVQDIYNELNRRGVFKSNPEAAAIGHELRRRGLIHDPSQGGAVSAPPLRYTMPPAQWKYLTGYMQYRAWKDSNSKQRKDIVEGYLKADPAYTKLPPKHKQTVLDNMYQKAVAASRGVNIADVSTELGIVPKLARKEGIGPSVQEAQARRQQQARQTLALRHPDVEAAGRELAAPSFKEARRQSAIAHRPSADYTPFDYALDQVMGQGTSQAMKETPGAGAAVGKLLSGASDPLNALMLTAAPMLGAAPALVNRALGTGFAAQMAQAGARQAGEGDPWGGLVTAGAGIVPLSLHALRGHAEAQPALPPSRRLALPPAPRGEGYTVNPQGQVVETTEPTVPTVRSQRPIAPDTRTPSEVVGQRVPGKPQQPVQEPAPQPTVTPTKPTAAVPTPQATPAVPKVGDTIEWKSSGLKNARTLQGEVVRLQEDPVTKQQVPIVKTAAGKEVPVAEWYDTGRVVPTPQEPTPTSAKPAEPDIYARSKAAGDREQAAQQRIDDLKESIKDSQQHVAENPDDEAAAKDLADQQKELSGARKELSAARKVSKALEPEIEAEMERLKAQAQSKPPEPPKPLETAPGAKAGQSEGKPAPAASAPSVRVQGKPASGEVARENLRLQQEARQQIPVQEPTPEEAQRVAAAAAAAAKEKVKQRSGLTPTQEGYRRKELLKVKAEGTSEPVRVPVPGDGEFTVNSEQAANLAKAMKIETPTAKSKPPAAPSSVKPEPPIVTAPEIRGGAPGGKTLKDWLRGVLPKKPAPGTISKAPGGLRAELRNMFVQGGSHLEAAAKKSGDYSSLRAMRKLAGSTQQARLMVERTFKRIQNEVYGGRDASAHYFRSALIEDRLMGLRTRWQDLSRAAATANPKDLQSAYPEFRSMLGWLEGARTGQLNPDGTPERFSDLIATARNYASNQSWQGLSAFLAHTFQRAADGVGHTAEFSKPGEFQKFTGTPEFAKALALYKEHLEAPLAKAHSSHEGIFSTAYGPHDTYYPLIALDEAGTVKPTGGGLRTPFAYRANAANKFATGLAGRYDPSAEALGQRIQMAMHSNNYGALLRTVRDAGLAKVVPPKVTIPANPIIDFGEGPEPAAKLEYRPSRTIIRGDKTFHTRTQFILVPKWLGKELSPLIEREGWKNPDTSYQRFINKVNSFSLVGLAEPAWHATNIEGAMVSEMPFVGGGLTRALGTNPATKIIATISQLWRDDPAAPEAHADMMHLAELGLLGQRIGGENVHGTGKLIYGARGIDPRARLAMYRGFKEMYKGLKGVEPSDEEIYNAVSQLGTYTHGLDSALERALKRSGVAPFATAGKTQLRLGVRAMRRVLPGVNTLPESLPRSRRIAYKTAQLISGGAAGVATLWAGTHFAYTGKWPWEDKKTKFLQIPVNPKDRASAIGQEIWGKGNSQEYVDMAFFSPSVAHGFRALGISGYATMRNQGHSQGEAIEQGFRDMLNAAGHPIVSGPLPRMGTAAVFGSAPYLTGLRNPITKVAGPQLLSVVGKDYGLRANVRESLLSANGFIQNVAANLGVGTKAEQIKDRDVLGRLLRMSLDLTAPRLLPETYPKKPKRPQSDPLAGMLRAAKK